MYRLLKVTGEQIRAGRALARIDQATLAARSGLSLETIKRLEGIRGPVEASNRTLIALGEAFMNLGVEFEEGLGVRLTRLPLEDSPRSPTASTDALWVDRSKPLHRLIYYSTAIGGGMALEDLDQFKSAAASRNASLGVTGLLLACDGRFLQLLEGEKSAVLQVYGSISADQRHHALHVIESRSTLTRQFSDWSFYLATIDYDDPLFSGELAFRDGFRPELLTPATACGFLTVLRDTQLLRGERTEAA